MRIFLFLFTLIFTCFYASSQNYQWANKIGSGDADCGMSIKADQSGSVYVTGYFAGTVDFDPGTGTANLNSSGSSRDGFVAKYTSAGQYIWAFKIGGSNMDVVHEATTDASGNVYISGYIRGSNVDFDPGPGTVFLSSNGDNGGDPGYGGDIFVAKYNSSGQYIWAFNVGSSSIGEDALNIVADPNGNVYVGGYFALIADFDPSAAVANLDGNSGTGFIASYNTNGQYRWAFNFGLGNGNSSTFGLRVDNSGNLYATGYFTGTNMDFNPSPTATNYLSSNGAYEIFIAKYNTLGQYQWAFSIGGGNSDVARDIEIDDAGNVYIAGNFDGNNIDFNPSPTATAFLSSNAMDVAVAKYNTNGQYQWAKRYGGSGSDLAWSIAYSNNHIYIIGSFQNSINFDPSGSDVLTASGGNDFYMTKFDVNGNYVCAFKVGGSGDDDGYRMDADNSGNLYITGILSSANTDFNPSTSVTNNLSTNGSSDIFIAKYNWPENVLPAGTLSGNTVCSGGQGRLTFTATNGTGPFTIQYSNGATTYTQTNVVSGVAFNLSPNPTTTTTYTLVSIKGSEKCPSVNYPTGVTATVTISGGSSADFSFTQSTCDPKTIQFFNTTPNTTSVQWFFGNSTTNTGSQSPTVTYAAFGTYSVKMKITTASGCQDSVTKQIPVLATIDSLITGRDTTICSGQSVQLNTLPNLNFCWSPTNGLNNSTFSNPVATPTATTTYYFTSQTTGSNLVTNGNFTAGNTGFTSDYTAQFPNTTEAVYWIANNPNAWNGAFSNCVEHTTGTGNMMMVNGSAVIGARVWSQTVTVTPNTNYAFSVWIQSLASLNPARLKFSINGYVLGADINAGSSACQWSRFFATWNSGNTTSATITIVNNNTIADGNDFAIDDISFAQVFLKTDSLKVTVVNPPNITASSNVSICKGQSTPLNASGATTYSWSPATGLSNPNIANPIATPTATTTYTVTAYNIPGCSVTKTVQVGVNDAVIPDFSFVQDVCNPKQVQFNNLATGHTSISWDFGNSTANTSSNNPVVTYSNYGTYPVKLKLTSSSGCIDSVTKQIPITVAIDSLITVADTTICRGSSVQLKTVPNLNFCWNPTTSLSNTNITNPIATPTSNTTYYFTSQTTGSNLVVNGDFSGGNSGFNSDYTPQFPNTTEAVYWIGNNPNAWNSAFSNCVEHTTGTGNMMMVNGSAVVGAKVWSQTVNVIPNTNYAFSVWVQSLAALNPAGLRFSINSSLAGININAGNTACQWSQFYTTWNSGNALTATITIVNNNTIADGNDFAIDDISFAQVFLKQDSVKITVTDAPDVRTTDDANFCEGDSLQLNTTGGTVYSWSPATGLSNANIANPMAKPTVTTKYFVTGYDLPGCVGKDSIILTVKQKPFITKSNDTAVCKGSPAPITTSATGNPTYTWFPVLGLNDGSINNPVANPDTTTTYILTTNGSNGCSNKDSVKITVKPVPSVKARIDTSVCEGIPVTLSTTNNGAASFSWLPSTGISDANNANPVATPSATTKYYVTVSNSSNCSAIDSVTLGILPKPQITKSKDTATCTNIPVNIFASSAAAVQYQWSPATGLSNSNIGNPTATATNTSFTTYYVTITAGNSCTNLDSVKVNVLPIPTVDTRIDTAVCNGTPLTFTTTSTGATSFTWNPTTALSNPNIINPVATPATRTKYIITVSNAGNCSAKDSITLDIKDLPIITKSNDTTICRTGSAPLSTSGGASYSWFPAQGLNNPNISNPVASPTDSTKYFVVVTGSNACSKTDSIKVGVLPKPTFSINPPAISICTGDSTLLTATGADTYKWFPAVNISLPNNSSTHVRPAATQQYSVEVIHTACRITDTLRSTVTVNPLPTVTVAKSNDIDCSNGSATLSATGGVNYSWTPNNNITGGGTSSPVVNPTQTTTYAVVITDSKGCKRTDSVKVTVLFAPVDGGYNMPNAFTPNGDNKNDCFGIKYWGNIEGLAFSVYNRWGERIFYTANPSACWDGTYKNVPQAAGTYVWQIKAKTACGEVYKKGTIVLIR